MQRAKIGGKSGVGDGAGVSAPRPSAEGVCVASARGVVEATAVSSRSTARLVDGLLGTAQEPRASAAHAELSTRSFEDEVMERR